MDEATFVETVETSQSTKLDRLASDRRLLAVTGPDLSVERVMTAALHAERMAKGTFEQWAQSESNPEVRAVFEDVVQTEAEHVSRVEAEGPIARTGEDLSALHRYLRSLEDTIPRVGAGLLGRPLVSSGTTLQFVSFFVNEADTRRADLFRDFRTETEAQIDLGRDLLSSLCTEESDWESAREAAESAIEIAYDEYAEELTALGVDPKPVC